MRQRSLAAFIKERIENERIESQTVTSITVSGERRAQDAGVGMQAQRSTAMKKIALLILAAAIVAGSVIMYRAAAKPHANAVRIAESCTGLQCWPTVPVRQPRSVRMSLTPVW